jgi:hypothetical protein
LANSLTAASPEYRSKRLQLLKKQKLICREIANMEERATLSNGIKVHRPYHSDVKVNSYTKGTAVSAQDVTVTDEYLTIDQIKEATVYIDKIDEIQNKYDVANKLIDRIGYALNKEIDGNFMSEVANMTYTIDDGDFGGTAGQPFSASVSTVFKLFTTVEAKMNTVNIEDTKPWFAVITPNLKALIQQTNLANGFRQADEALTGTLKGMGYLGTWGNMNIFVSNSVKHTQKFTTTAILVAGDTVSVAGVTFTACADGAASGAGGFSIQGSEDLCMAQLVAAINGSGTPGADAYIALSQANRAILANAGVTASYASHVLTITSFGPAAIVYTPTGTSYGTVNTTTADCWFGQYGCTDLVLQADVTVQMNKEPLLTGYNYLCYDLYGKKTFAEGQARGVKVSVVA